MRFAESWSTFRARQTTLKAINDGDVKLAQWWLEKKARFEFSSSKLALWNVKATLFINITG
jgi:hypothetical protein